MSHYDCENPSEPWNAVIGLIASVSRHYVNCLDIHVCVHQGQWIERVHRAPPAPLDGLPDELRQMI